MAQHTPGPWEVSTGGGCRLGIWGQGTTARRLVAQVNVVASGAEREANARLIAAAPRLLEVCEAICDSTVLLPESIARQIVEAIAAARGE